jgi:hypothetical protein
MIDTHLENLYCALLLLMDAQDALPSCEIDAHRLLRDKYDEVNKEYEALLKTE